MEQTESKIDFYDILIAQRLFYIESSFRDIYIGGKQPQELRLAHPELQQVLKLHCQTERMVR